MPDRPREMKEITFYQLSSQIVSQNIKEEEKQKKHGKDSRQENESKDDTTSSTQKHTVGLVLADLPGYRFNNIQCECAHEGILELQCELASLVLDPRKKSS